MATNFYEEVLRLISGGQVGGVGINRVQTQTQGTAADGAPLSGNPVPVAGVDGTGNVQAILTDVQGRVQTQTQGTAADGAPASGNPVQVAGVDANGNVQTILTDSQGRLLTSPTFSWDSAPITAYTSASPNFFSSATGAGWTVPSGVEWRVLVATATLTTSIAVSNRHFQLLIETSGLVTFNVGTSPVQTASQAMTHIFRTIGALQTAAPTGASTTASFNPIASDVIVGGTNPAPVVRFFINGAGSGDAISNPSILVLSRPKVAQLT